MAKQRRGTARTTFPSAERYEMIIKNSSQSKTRQHWWCQRSCSATLCCRYSWYKVCCSSEKNTQ